VRKAIWQRGKNMSKRKKDRIKELAFDIDILDHMVAALVDVLEKKGILTSEEWEKEIKAKIETAAKTTKSFRDIES
jgi:predicted DNA-binding transcriptional regulator